MKTKCVTYRAVIYVSYNYKDKTDKTMMAEKIFDEKIVIEEEKFHYFNKNKNISAILDRFETLHEEEFKSHGGVDHYAILLCKRLVNQDLRNRDVEILFILPFRTLTTVGNLTRCESRKVIRAAQKNFGILFKYRELIGKPMGVPGSGKGYHLWEMTSAESSIDGIKPDTNR